MKQTLIICLIFLLPACGQQNNVVGNGNIENQLTNLTDSSQSFSITKTTFTDFEKAKKIYIDKLIQDTLKFKKVNGVIVLPLHRPHYPPSVIFKDTLVGIGETDEREYNYIGHFAYPEYYLVSGAFWEFYEYYIIDKESGRTISTWNRPVLSPNSKYFANLSLTYGLDGFPNGIQIWKFEKEGQNYLSKYFELDQQVWVPNDFVWESDNSLILKVISVEKYFTDTGVQKENDFYYLKLRLK